jgi:hypothetical protein
MFVMNQVAKHITISILLIFFAEVNFCDSINESSDSCDKLMLNLQYQSVHCSLVWFVVFNATFSNISAISWRPVLVVKEARAPGENHQPWANNW